MKRSTTAIVLALALTTSASLAQDSVGTAFTYQGQLEQDGLPVTGPANFIFSLWDAAVGGNDLAYFEAPSDTPVVDGLFTVYVDFDMSQAWLYDGTALWIQIAVDFPAGTGIYETLSPRQPLTSTPYSSFAIVASATPWAGILDIPPGFADGVDDVGDGSFWSLTGNAGTTPGTNFLGTTDDTPLELRVDGMCAFRLQPVEGGYPNVIGGRSDNYAGAGTLSATIGGGRLNSVYAWHCTIGGGVGNEAHAHNTTIGGGDYNVIGDVAGWATIAGGRENEATQEYAMIPGGAFNFAGGECSFAAGHRAKVRGPDEVGGNDTNGDEGTFVWADSEDEDFWSTGPNQFLIRAAGGVGINTDDPGATFHVNGYGIGARIETTAPSVPSVFFTGTHTELYADNGFALYAETTKPDATGITYGVYGKSSNASIDPYAIGFGGFFESAGTSGGAGVYGKHTYKGVHGYADGSGGSGVYGRHWTDSSGYGGYFLTRGDRSSAGVVGINDTSYDTEGRLAYVGSSPEFPIAAGVYGTETSSGYGYAGYFVGEVFTSGKATDAGRTLMIDHPLDPENKYLQHSAVESSEMLDVYNGNVTLDDDGTARVTLPEWFEALNRNFRYQLTCIGGFAPVYIASEISDNQFSIAGGTPGLKVSWQVTGVRHDPWANANPTAVELDKPEHQRGLYLHPDAYAQPAERGVNYADRFSLSAPPENPDITLDTRQLED